jgi:hypothetical protein
VKLSPTSELEAKEVVWVEEAKAMIASWILVIMCAMIDACYGGLVMAPPKKINKAVPFGRRSSVVSVARIFFMVDYVNWRSTPKSCITDRRRVNKKVQSWKFGLGPLSMAK